MDKIKKMLEDLEKELRQNKQYSAADKLLPIIEEARKDGWIPVSERLPEKNGHYLVVADCGISEKLYRQSVKYWYGEGQKWMPNNYAPSTHFVAWMPLPEPYKGE